MSLEAVGYRQCLMELEYTHHGIVYLVVEGQSVLPVNNKGDSGLYLCVFSSSSKEALSRSLGDCPQTVRKEHSVVSSRKNIFIGIIKIK